MRRMQEREGKRGREERKLINNSKANIFEMKRIFSKVQQKRKAEFLKVFKVKIKLFLSTFFSGPKTWKCEFKV